MSAIPLRVEHIQDRTYAGGRHPDGELMVNRVHKEPVCILGKGLLQPGVSRRSDVPGVAPNPPSGLNARMIERGTQENSVFMVERRYAPDRVVVADPAEDRVEIVSFSVARFANPPATIWRDTRAHLEPQLTLGTRTRALARDVASRH